MRRESRLQGFVAATLAAMLLCGAVPASASPESVAFTAQGVERLRAQDFEGALQAFERAGRADPRDAEALFFQGVALNRLARHADALGRLERSRSLGGDHPDLDFETGWGLMAVGRAREAVEVLERYERAHPGRGQTSEFLGRAYLGIGDLDRAERKLREAVERDARLRPTVLVYLAQVEQARGRAEEAARRLTELLREAPDAPLSRTLREQLERLVPPRVVKPWRITVSAAGGWNSNVIALGDDIPVPADISSQRSGFARFTLGASYDWALTRADTLSAGYGFLADVYENVPSFDVRDHVFSLDWVRTLGADWSASLRLSDEFTEVGGRDFRNQVSVRPALAYRPADWAVAELAYTFSSSDYFFPTSRTQDRDSSTHTVAVAGFATVPGTRLLLRLVYFHIDNDADGPDFDFKTHGVQIGASHPLPGRLAVEVFWTHTMDDYDNRNSLAGPTGFGFRRLDDVDAVTVQLSRPITDWLSAYARYDYSNADSNISFFTYHQNVWSFGLVASY